jgi:hypothetical protein
MNTRPLVTLIFMTFFLSSSWTSAQNTSPGLTPWEQKCQSYESQDLCAQEVAKNLYLKHAEIFSHTGEHLVVKLNSGRTKLFSDAAVRYAVTDYIPEANYLVVRQQYSQGNTWLILSLQSGLLTKIDGYPIFSPQHQYFFAWESNLSSPINPPITRIFRSSHPVPIPEWKSECEDILEWQLARANWQTDQLLVLEQGIASPQKVEVKKLKKVQAYGVRWSATNLDCSAR